MILDSFDLQASRALALKNETIDELNTKIEELEQQIHTLKQLIVPAAPQLDAENFEKQISDLRGKLGDKENTIMELESLILAREAGGLALVETVREFIAHECEDFYSPEKELNNNVTPDKKTPTRVEYWQQRLQEKANESAARLQNAATWEIESQDSYTHY